MMYRETLLGLAMAATLHELSSTQQLTEGQKEHLWRVFDESMEKCVAEAPLMTRVNVRAPLPSLPRRTRRAEGDNVIPLTMPAPSPHAEATVEHTAAQGAQNHISTTTTTTSPAPADGQAESSAPLPVSSTPQPGGPPFPSSSSLQAVTEATAGSSGPPAPPRVESEEDVAFPVYRCSDWVWTILLKDPVVEVRDEFGTEERIQLDYLKVVLKDAAGPSSTTKRPQARRKRPRKAG